MGIPTIEVDGNSLPDMLEAGAQAVARARSGQGPVFIHARTFRLNGHTAADAAKWRDADEVERRWAADPLLATRAQVLASGVGEDAIAAAEKDIRDEILDAYVRAVAAPFPPASTAFDDVQTVGSPQNGAY